MDIPHFEIEVDERCFECERCEIHCYKRAIMDLINDWDDGVGWKDIEIGGTIAADRSDHSFALWLFTVKDVDFDSYTIYLSDLSVVS